MTKNKFFQTLVTKTILLPGLNEKNCWIRSQEAHARTVGISNHFGKQLGGVCNFPHFPRFHRTLPHSSPSKTSSTLTLLCLSLSPTHTLKSPSLKLGSELSIIVPIPEVISTLNAWIIMLNLCYFFIYFKWVCFVVGIFSFCSGKKWIPDWLCANLSPHLL